MDAETKGFTLLGLLTLANCWLAAAMTFEYLTVPVGMTICGLVSILTVITAIRWLMPGELPWRAPSRKDTDA